jgi:alanyl-tRNA synthetase
MDANELRRRFLQFFADRGHTVVPSASLIPHDPTVMFTIAGMVPFKPYFVGDEPAPYPRAASVQKCFRTADIDLVGTTARHLTFFEMLGNFSFGDYFKAEAIPAAWELLTGALGIEAGRLWVTVHEGDEEAETIWRDAVGVPAERIQRLGEDNFWSMGGSGVGPCGPSSEVHFDRGQEHGEAGGPAGGSPERYVEIWNLVFMELNRLPDGSLAELPRKNIDTGAGLDRILSVLQGVDSVFETDLLGGLVASAEKLTGARYGDGADTDVGLRILADHGRAMTFLVADGVLPSNEGPGYVLRRVIRRAVRRAYQMEVEEVVTPGLVQAVVDSMGEAYPEIRTAHDFVASVVAREEERFRQTLRSGTVLLEEELARAGATIPGEVAFRLHDTYGFPIDLTREIAEERGVGVDLEGFEAAMAEQRQRAREAGRAAGPDEAEVAAYRELLEQFGTTQFTGYREYTSSARVLAVLEPAGAKPERPEGAGRGTVEIFLDRSPFYAEGGGQVGDTGSIATATGRARVVDTTSALPGLIRHLAVVESGEVRPGQEGTATIDGERRDSIRRNHTATHLLHWALRQVLGDHVKQQGSLVAPDRLRFDFSHFAAVSDEDIAAVESLVNARVLANEGVRAYETTKEHADEVGAVAFFGDKYGDIVRVVEAGSDSVELCGGTHVGALGMIGPIRIVSEGSIGSNTRRIEALTGERSLAYMREAEHTLARAGELLRIQGPEVPQAVEKLLQRQRDTEEELRRLRAAQARDEAAQLATAAENGLVVARRDGLAQGELRELAVAVRDQPGLRAVVLIGSPDGQRVALVAAVAKGGDLVASELISDAARAVGGGGGRDPELAVAGGKEAGAIDEALAGVRGRLGLE